MHLLASQPGGFVDTEGIVDLCQSAADMVILSAADSSLTALAERVDGRVLSLDGDPLEGVAVRAVREVVADGE
ncbi:MAG: hypothetical protein P8Y45_10185, partial [Exilibacterium sp.]